MIVVDSSVWIDYFNGKTTRQTDLLNALLDQELIVVGDLILTEVLQGFRTDRDFQRARQLLDTFLFAEMLGKELALASAQNYRRLRSKGVTVRKTIDVTIATFCIQNQLPLLHCDRDFDTMVRYLKLETVM
jgi:predicted nucleic acid-binding protein